MKINKVCLNNAILRNQCGGLNIEADSDISNIFDDSDTTIKSNKGDATMIASIKFKDQVNIEFIKIVGISDETNPVSMKCYINKLDIDFSDVSDIPATQNFDLSKDINKEIRVNIPKWKNVSELTLYLENEEAEQLIIKQVAFYGSSGYDNLNIGMIKKGDDEENGIYNLNKGESIDNFIGKNPGKYIFIDFHAEWCGPCKQLGPILCQKAIKARALVLKIDIDKHRDIASSYGISSIPFIILMKDGTKLDTMVGFNPQKLEQMINLISH